MSQLGFLPALTFVVNTFATKSKANKIGRQYDWIFGSHEARAAASAANKSELMLDLVERESVAIRSQAGALADEYSLDAAVSALDSALREREIGRLVVGGVAVVSVLSVLYFLSKRRVR